MFLLLLKVLIIHIIRANNNLFSVKLGVPSVGTMKNTIFCSVTLHSLIVYEYFGGKYSLCLQGQSVSSSKQASSSAPVLPCLLLACWAYCSTLWMESVCSSRTSVNFCQTLQYPILELLFLTYWQCGLHMKLPSAGCL
jgi:hypothetical protein